MKLFLIIGIVYASDQAKHLTTSEKNRNFLERDALQVPALQNNPCSTLEGAYQQCEFQQEENYLNGYVQEQSNLNDPEKYNEDPFSKEYNEASFYRFQNQNNYYFPKGINEYYDPQYHEQLNPQTPQVWSELNPLAPEYVPTQSSYYDDSSKDQEQSSELPKDYLIFLNQETDPVKIHTEEAKKPSTNFPGHTQNSLQRRTIKSSVQVEDMERTYTQISEDEDEDEIGLRELENLLSKSAKGENKVTEDYLDKFLIENGDKLHKKRMMGKSQMEFPNRFTGQLN